MTKLEKRTNFILIIGCFLIGLVCIFGELWWISTYGDALYTLSALGVLYLFIAFYKLWMVLPSDSTDELIVERLFSKMKVEKTTTERVGGQYHFNIGDKSVKVWDKGVEIEDYSPGCSPELRKKLFKHCVNNTKENQNNRQTKNELKELFNKHEVNT